MDYYRYGRKFKKDNCKRKNLVNVKLTKNADNSLGTTRKLGFLITFIRF